MRYSGSIDTNIILRYLIGDVKGEYELTAKLLKEVTSQLAVADIAIVETVHVMSRYYDMSREDIAEVITDFINLPIINCNKMMVHRALSLFVAFPAQSFEDCFLSIYAELDDAQPLHTFDKKMAAQLSGVKLLK